MYIHMAHTLSCMHVYTPEYIATAFIARYNMPATWNTDYVHNNIKCNIIPSSPETIHERSLEITYSCTLRHNFHVISPQHS